jgi:hypothetical protein
MKYFTKLGLYKASNVEFNPKTLIATSYDWWTFVRQVDGKVLFNTYRYSPTTGRHQAKVRSLMNSLGISFEEVAMRESLCRFENLEQVYAAHTANLENNARLKEAKRIERNRLAKERRQALKALKSEGD